MFFKNNFQEDKNLFSTYFLYLDFYLASFMCGMDSVSSNKLKDVASYEKNLAQNEDVTNLTKLIFKRK